MKSCITRVATDSTVTPGYFPLTGPTRVNWGLGYSNKLSYVQCDLPLGVLLIMIVAVALVKETRTKSLEKRIDLNETSNGK